MRTDRRLTFVGCLTVLLATGCFDPGTSGDSGSGSGTGRIHLVPAISGGESGLGKVGTSGSTGLESFQVAVGDIRLAKDITTDGTAMSGMSNSLTLFSQQLGDISTLDEAAVRDPAWSPHYIDFCDPNSVSCLASSKPFTLRDTGDYYWAVLDWSPFFKIRATIPLPGGDTIFTHDGPIGQHFFPGSDVDYYVTESAQDLRHGPAEDALVRKNSTITWFRFLKPLRLTEADLDSGTTIADTVGMDSDNHPIVKQVPSGKWNVLLVFNPEDLLWAQLDGNRSFNPSVRSPDSSASVNVPFLRATAVPYREGEDVMRETYEFSMQAVSVGVEGTYGMRLELYLIGDNVVASTAQSYPTDGNLPPSEPPIIYYAVGRADGSLSLQDYKSRPIFDGFVRKTTVGEEGSVPWGYGASADGRDARSLTYKLAEIKKMN
jgi:hypothetical protein